MTTYIMFGVCPYIILILKSFLYGRQDMELNPESRHTIGRCRVLFVLTQISYLIYLSKTP